MSGVAGTGIVIQVAPHGERDRLVTLFCAERGRIRGLVKGRKTPLQPLDGIAYTHYRRLPTQLGTLDIDLTRSRAGWWLGGRLGNLATCWLAELLRETLPEEHAYAGLSDEVDALLETGIDGDLWRRVAGFELALLRRIGYGLPLAEDAVPCSQGTPLAYVSPKTGRAVSAAMGAAFAPRLLELPALFGGPACGEAEDCRRSLRLTGYFLNQALGRKVLEARPGLVEALENSGRGELERAAA